MTTLAEMKAESGCPDLIHELIGCAWGRTVATPDDLRPCEEQAVRIIVLHDGPREAAFKFCAHHVDRVMEETNPHES